MKTPLARYAPYTTHAFAFIAFLLFAHWLTVFLTHNDPAAAATTQASWFDLDREYNVPTATNSVLLALSGLASLSLARPAKFAIQKAGWLLFGLFFMYLALDEMLILHEQLAEPVRELLSISGSNPLYHAWVVPGLFIVLFMVLLVAIIRKYHRELRMFSDILLVVAILAGGVIALEIVGTFVYPHTLAYRAVMIPLEEIFELTMATVILRKLLTQSVR